MPSSSLWALLLALALLLTGGASPIEDQLETQIDPTPPRSFSTPETLWARQFGFRDIFTYNKDTGKYSDVIHVGNWEVYAFNYWYETRPAQGMACPVKPRGIAAACDWALTIPCLYGDVTKPPRVVYVHTYMLPHFFESTLNFLPNKSWEFVLVSGGTDMTIPNNNMDVRFRKALRGFGWGGKYFDAIVNHPQIIHWYAENRDRMDHPKFSPLPTGADDEYYDPNNYPNASSWIPLNMRPLLVMSSDRVRTGSSQWDSRLQVLNYCKNSSFCMQPFGGVYAQVEGGVPIKDFNMHMAGLPFIACVHGGGVDPSPKAWDAIRIGTIPIIQKLTVEEAYEHLPVAMVNNWEELFLHPDPEAILRAWLHLLGPYYEQNSYLRGKALNRLKTSYWMGLFEERIEFRKVFKKLNISMVQGESLTKSRDHVMSASIEDALRLIQENPGKFSSDSFPTVNMTAPPPPSASHNRTRHQRRRLRAK